MRRLQYIAPEVQIVTVELQQFIALSGGDEQDTNIVIGDDDESTGTNRSRGGRNVWDDEEGEDW